MPKESLKDKLEGDELDLGLNNLSTVPVKELSLLPKARRLDLSCNTITTLPDAFCDLNHLIKIDFSKNQLEELPERFGALSNLEHLDLLGNQLKILPISFCHLNKLKWLDLKDNPLKDDLKKAAGDCLDEKQCKACAKNVIFYMKQINSELERRKQKELQKKREEEEKIKALEEAAKEKVRQERKLKRRRQRQEAEDSIKAEEKTKEVNSNKDDSNLSNGTAQSESHLKKKKASSGFGRFMYRLAVFMAVLAVLFALVIGLVDYCESNIKDTYCKNYWQPLMQKTQLRPSLKTTRDHVFVLCNEARVHVMAFLDNVKNGIVSGASTGGSSGKT